MPLKQPHLSPRRNRFLAAALLAAGLALGGSSSTSAFAQTLQTGGFESGTPMGDWVTTGKAVAATTFTQTSQAAPDEAATALFDDPYFAQETPAANVGDAQAETDPFFHSGRFAAQTGGENLFGYRNTSTPVFDNGAFGGAGGVAAVPEPGIMVTVVALGFTTGVALLRGKKRVTYPAPPFGRYL